jgi:(p)ppGpp synthase/HD superfamily hydrolase
VIHRDNCRNLAEYRKQPAKWLPVDWTRGVKADFDSEIQVRTLDRVGLLAEVAGRISATRTNIEHVRVDTEGDASTLSFRLKVRDRRQLAQVVRSIRTIPGVVRVSRSAG